MIRILTAFLTNRSGSAAIEYSLVAALIGIAIIAGLTTLGSNLATSINGVASNVATAK